MIRIILPDSHGHLISRSAMQTVLKDIKELDPSEVVLLGDHVDCSGIFTTHKRSYKQEMEYSYLRDIEYAKVFLDGIQECAPRARIHYLEGNHECVTSDHEILTRKGWLPIAQATTSEEVGALSADGSFVWERPLQVIEKSFNGELFVSDTAHWSIAMTPNHRVLYYGQYAKDLKYRSAESLPLNGTVHRIPTTGKNNRKDYSISNDELEICAWMLTDGNLSNMVIYQSKPERIEQIKQLLERLSIEYTLSFREARVKQINGIQIKSSLPCGAFYLKASTRKRIAELLELTDWHYGHKHIKKIPSWVNKLSQKQFQYFLHKLIEGDGHFTSSIAGCLYGKEEFLEELQTFCVQNGVRASLRKRTNKNTGLSYSVLQTKINNSARCSDLLEKRKYEGLVHCLEMPSGNFFVRRNGVVHVTGNCRIERWAVNTFDNKDDVGYFLSAFSPISLLQLESRNIQYFRMSEKHMNLSHPGTIKLGKCFFTHGIVANKHATAKHLERFGANVVHGHTHRMQAYATRIIATGEIGAWCPGTLSELQPMYMHTNPSEWSNGYGVQLVNEKTGAFLHVNVPICEDTSLLHPLLYKTESGQKKTSRKD